MAILWTLSFGLVLSVNETYFGSYSIMKQSRKEENSCTTVFSSVMLYKFQIKYTHLNVVTAVILVVSPKEFHIVARSNSDSANFYLNLCNPQITRWLSKLSPINVPQNLSSNVNVHLFLSRSTTKVSPFNAYKNEASIAEDSQHFNCCVPPIKLINLEQRIFTILCISVHATSQILSCIHCLSFLSGNCLFPPVGCVLPAEERICREN